MCETRSEAGLRHLAEAIRQDAYLDDEKLWIALGRAIAALERGELGEGPFGDARPTGGRRKA